MLALALSLVALSLAAPGALPAQSTSREPVRSTAAPRSDGEGAIVCRGAQIPDGWILVDDLRSTELCGGDNPAAVNLYNVWAIQRYADRPVGSTLEVCAAVPTPAGWVVEDVFRSKDRCGHPEEAFIVNVKRIRRVR